MSCGRKINIKADSLDKLRDFSNNKIEINLSRINLIFDNERGDWKSIIN